MRRIYRDAKNSKIAGICYGLGDVLSVDPTIIRLVIVFACILTGFFPLILTYLVGWFIIPTKEEIDHGNRGVDVK